MNCDAVTSTSAPLLPNQPACPALLIELAASESLAEIDCAAVSSTSYIPPTTPFLALAPAGYLFVMGFSHLSPTSSSLQQQSLPE